MKRELRLLFVVIIFFLAGSFASAQGTEAVKIGDVDANGVLQLTDAVYLLNYLFLGGSKPPCLDIAEDIVDVDNNQRIDLTDSVYLLDFLFLGGPAPQVTSETRSIPRFACDAGNDLDPESPP